MYASARSPSSAVVDSSPSSSTSIVPGSIAGLIGYTFARAVRNALRDASGRPVIASCTSS